MTENSSITYAFNNTQGLGDERDKKAIQLLLNKAIEDGLIYIPDRHPFAEKDITFRVTFSRRDFAGIASFSMPMSEVEMNVREW